MAYIYIIWIFVWDFSTINHPATGGYPHFRKLLYGWMDGWVDGWMGGWVDGWMGGWVDGWMDGQATFLC